MYLFNEKYFINKIQNDTYLRKSRDKFQYITISIRRLLMTFYSIINVVILYTVILIFFLFFTISLHIFSRRLFYFLSIFLLLHAFSHFLAFLHPFSFILFNFFYLFSFPLFYFFFRPFSFFSFCLLFLICYRLLKVRTNLLSILISYY